MIHRFGEEATEEMMHRKENDPQLKETECRYHPDCPGVEAGSGYWARLDMLLEF